MRNYIFLYVTLGIENPTRFNFILCDSDDSLKLLEVTKENDSPLPESYMKASISIQIRMTPRNHLFFSHIFFQSKILLEEPNKLTIEISENP